MKKLWFTAFLVLGLVFSAFAVSATENTWPTKLDEVLSQSQVMIEMVRNNIGSFEGLGAQLLIQTIVVRIPNTYPVMGLVFTITDNDKYFSCYIDFDEITPLRDVVKRFCEINLQSGTATNEKDYIYQTKSGLYIHFMPETSLSLSLPRGGYFVLMDHSEIRALEGYLDDANRLLSFIKHLGS